jgi:hypothetical protein
MVGRRVPGVANPDLGQPLAEGVDHGPDVLGRDQRAADGGALLPGLLGQLARHLGHEQPELLGAGGGVGAEDRAVQRVGLGVEPDRLADHRRMAAQRLAVAAEPVKAMVSCPVRWSNRSPTAPHSSWIDPGGSAARLDHVPEGQLGDVRVWLAGLTIAGTAGEHGRGQLLQHPPDREVEGVDEHAHPAGRCRHAGRRRSRPGPALRGPST